MSGSGVSPARGAPRTRPAAFPPLRLGLGVAGTLSGFIPLRAAMQRPRGSKVVVVTFGGGARDAETFAPEGQGNILHMFTG